MQVGFLKRFDCHSQHSLAVIDLQIQGARDCQWIDTGIIVQVLHNN